MDSPISRAEHEEFRKTINAEMDTLKAEDVRINKRLIDVETATKQIQELALSIQKLATNMETMCKTQEAEGKRLTELESKDGEKWRQVSSYIITVIIGLVVGFIFTQIGIG